MSLTSPCVFRPATFSPQLELRGRCSISPKAANVNNHTRALLTCCRGWFLVHINVNPTSTSVRPPTSTMAARNALRRSLLYSTSLPHLPTCHASLPMLQLADQDPTTSPRLLPTLHRQISHPHRRLPNLRPRRLRHAQSNKANARRLVKEAIDKPIPQNTKERAVRINAVSSGLALDDLTEVLQSPNLTTLVVPKVDSASDLTFVKDVIDHARPKGFEAVNVLGLVESARSLTDLNEICRAAPGLLSGLTFAAEDFALGPKSYADPELDRVPLRQIRNRHSLSRTQPPQYNRLSSHSV